MRVVSLKPILGTKTDYEEIEKRIKKAFLEIVYHPLLEELQLPKKKLKNAIEDLITALNEGRVIFSQGAFRGSFDATTTKEIKKLGGKWDGKKTFKIPLKDLPYDIRAAILSSKSLFSSKMEKIDRKLAKISPEDIAEQIKITDVFDDTLWKVEKDFQSSVDKITVAPELTQSQAKRIADEWQNNMDIWIKDFTKEQIQELREMIKANVYAGDRFEALIPPIETMLKGIKKSYRSVENKAKFLARQETNLLIAKFKKVRYLDAGIREYYWKCVRMPHDKNPKKHTPGNVRYSHGLLEDRSNRGETFKFDQPPVTTAPGEPIRHNNPGEDYNCLPGSAFVSFHGPINKAFRRLYSGELVELVTDNGMTVDTTANHPILTQRGWIAAKDIKIGDNVFSSKFESFFTKEMNSKNMKASIKEVFDALSFCIEIRSNLLTESDFHNDVGEDKEVDIISMDSGLILKTIAAAKKELFSFLFQRSNSSSFAFSPNNRLLKNLLGGSSFSYLVSLLHQLLFILESHLSHADKTSFGIISDDDSRFQKPFADGDSSDPILFCDSKLTHPILIILNSLLIEGQSIVSGSSSPFDNHSHSSEPSTQKIFIHADHLADFSNTEVSSVIDPLRVIDKRLRNSKGHVYNFQTDLNWYLTENIIIHNCRCFAIPVIKF